MESDYISKPNHHLSPQADDPLLDNAGSGNFGTTSVDMSAIEYYSIFIYFIVSSVYLNEAQSLYVSSEVPATRLRRLQ